MRKPAFCICETKTQISAFVFATRIVQSLYFLNTKFQVPNNLLWLYSPVCVGSGQKPQKTVFSQRGSFSHRLVCPLVTRHFLRNETKVGLFRCMLSPESIETRSFYINRVRLYAVDLRLYVVIAIPFFTFDFKQNVPMLFAYR